MSAAYINRIETAVPPNDVHAGFRRVAATLLPDDRRQREVFERMAARSGIEHRYSFLMPNDDSEAKELDYSDFYLRGDFPSTAARMNFFENHAPALASQAVENLALGGALGEITHLLITSCTGFYAPGIDLEIIERCRLSGSIERSIIGFMGCYAAISALKLARHIVRSEPSARVLIVNLELCTLHMQDTNSVGEMLMSLLWGDGCAASLVTREPDGLEIDCFRSLVLPNSGDLMQWHIGDSGFKMVLSGKVPSIIMKHLRVDGSVLLDGGSPRDIDHWAVHAGGRTVLDAVESGFELAPTALHASRDVLRQFGNMSSATVMFVLRAMLTSAKPGARGCAMSFGPGLTAETMLFHVTTRSPTRGNGRYKRRAGARHGHEFAA